MIGISAPGGYYVPFIEKYLNYVLWYRSFLLHGVSSVMSIFGYNTILVSIFVIKIVNANSVQLVYSCLGFGVLSFWVAFVLANEGKIFFKLKWALTGFFLISFCNILRISFILIATNKDWMQFLPLEHHTTYNIISYGILMILIYFYTKKLPKPL